MHNNEFNAQEHPQQPESQPRRNRRKIALITGAAVAALLVVGGGAYAVGVSVSDEAEDHRPASFAGGDEDGDDSERAANESDSDRATTNAPVQDSGGTTAPLSDAAALRTVAETAIAAVGGDGVTSIDVELRGYEFEVRLSDGAETDVFVATDGTVTTAPDTDRESRSEPILDLDSLDAVMTAGLAAVASASATDGSIDSIASSDDAGVSYEVSIRLADGRDADVDLDGGYAAVSVDVDDD